MCSYKKHVTDNICYMIPFSLKSICVYMCEQREVYVYIGTCAYGMCVCIWVYVQVCMWVCMCAYGCV